MERDKRDFDKYKYPSSSSGQSNRANVIVAPDFLVSLKTLENKLFSSYAILIFSLFKDTSDSSCDFEYVPSSNAYEESLEESLQSAKIRILPHMGVRAGLNKQDFDISLDEISSSWFQKTNEIYRTCKWIFINWILVF